MAVTSINFRFRQRFSFPARRVYAWATDFQPDDVARLGQTGRRKIERLNDDTVILTDTIRTGEGGRLVKRRLVRLYPDRLSWTNTHTAGPSLHSQFLYEIVPEGQDSCRLEFTGRQLVYGEPVDAKEKARLVRETKKHDAAAWRNLARELAADLKPARPPSVSRRASSRS